LYFERKQPSHTKNSQEHNIHTNSGTGIILYCMSLCSTLHRVQPTPEAQTSVQDWQQKLWCWLRHVKTNFTGNTCTVDILWL